MGCRGQNSDGLRRENDVSQIKDFRDLRVWQRAVDLASAVYVLTRAFPSEEKFGLSNQLRRAVISVSSNIAEGHARTGKEFRSFLSIARGSVAEVESQLLVAVRFGFVSADEIATALSYSVEIRKMLTVLAQRLSSAT